jgi:hypothetical protein
MTFQAVPREWQPLPWEFGKLRPSPARTLPATQKPAKASNNASNRRASYGLTMVSPDLSTFFKSRPQAQAIVHSNQYQKLIVPLRRQLPHRRLESNQRRKVRDRDRDGYQTPATELAVFYASHANRMPEHLQQSNLLLFI